MKQPLFSGYYSEHEQAARLGTTVTTLRRWRRLGKGPRVTIIGRRSFYSREAEIDWLKQQEMTVEELGGCPRQGASV